MGSALQFIGGFQQARATREAGRAQADAIREQAAAEERAANFNADLLEQQGLQREAFLRRRSRQAQGGVRARIAKSGVRLEGSPLQALAQGAAESEIDALNVRFDAQTQARLERMAGRNAVAQGNRAAENARRQASQQATAILLQTVGQAANSAASAGFF